jgi:hypothetical protein
MEHRFVSTIFWVIGSLPRERSFIPLVLCSLLAKTVRANHAKKTRGALERWLPRVVRCARQSAGLIIDLLCSYFTFSEAM